MCFESTENNKKGKLRQQSVNGKRLLFGATAVTMEGHGGKWWGSGAVIGLRFRGFVGSRASCAFTSVTDLRYARVVFSIQCNGA